MSDYAILSTTIKRSQAAIRAPVEGCVRRDEVESFARQRGKRIECSSGYLWVTLEGDTEDYVLRPGEGLRIPNRGRVLVSGRGCFKLS